MGASPPLGSANHSLITVISFNFHIASSGKTNWTAHARRFLNRNWKFLVQSGITILSILHK